MPIYPEGSVDGTIPPGELVAPGSSDPSGRLVPAEVAERLRAELDELHDLIGRAAGAIRGGSRAISLGNAISRLGREGADDLAAAVSDAWNALIDAGEILAGAGPSGPGTAGGDRGEGVADG